MDEILGRFPHLGHKVFKQLDDQSLSKCRIINKFWQKFLENEKGKVKNDSVLLKRKIQKFIKNQVVFIKSPD